ncbi:hypothetical protein MES5069_310076 [Mesorhizobium escarrei]|uniref:Tn3 transposase DDE domain-containing protein n=1 Tax=Mesorhizobium escarrei TaxID=666018 RepID=A0ABM9DZW6_9HYPH|nr:hypothetical protein MES5069_310076 [Mesorhizobium escarrei]
MVFEHSLAPALPSRLDKGDAAHKLKRPVFFRERGEIRDRSFESQAFSASGLNLVVSAIVHWNTVYLDRAATHLRMTDRIIPNDLLKHVSPLTLASTRTIPRISGESFLMSVPHT